MKANNNLNKFNYLLFPKVTMAYKQLNQKLKINPYIDNFIIE